MNTLGDFDFCGKPLGGKVDGPGYVKYIDWSYPVEGNAERARRLAAAAAKKPDASDAFNLSNDLRKLADGWVSHMEAKEKRAVAIARAQEIQKNEAAIEAARAQKDEYRQRAIIAEMALSDAEDVSWAGVLLGLTILALAIVGVVDVVQWVLR